MGRKRTQLTPDDVIEKKRIKQNNNHLIHNGHHNITRKVGVIKRMILKNFMCHSHLEVVFEKNINFVAGNNGAGKSAILTALVIGLGGKVTATNRGTNIKALIKVGKTSASIEIIICNEGPEAYKPSMYGDEITVIRTIYSNGGGSYKVKSSGQTLSQSSREVQNIVSYMNIQITNPVCVLNQDTARNFLSSNDPKQKFTFFIKGSRLEQLGEECVKLKDSFHKLKDIFAEKLELSQNIRKEVKEYKQKIDDHKNMLQLEGQYRELANEATWATIQEKEQEVEKQEEIVKQLEKIVDKYENIIKNRANLNEENRIKLNELEQKINEINDSIRVQSRPLNEIEQQINKFNGMIDTQRLERSRLLKMINMDEKNIERLQNDIKNYVENMSQKEQEKLVRKKDIDNHKEQIRLIQDTLETTQNEMYQLKSSLSKTEQEENGLVQECRDLQRQLDAIKDDIESLKAKSATSLQLYGKIMPQVVNAIKSNGSKFNKLPKGPLGAYIKIKDKKWAVAVEGFIGAGLLQSFTVDNTSDNRQLTQILDKYYQSSRLPAIITSKFIDTVHNVKPNLVHSPPDCISLFDVIEVKDPVVMNCLIDQLGIENILLIPSSNRAIELLSDRQNVPINCKQGVTIKGDRFYPDPNYRSYCSQYHQARFLEVDKAEVIKSSEDKYRQVQGKIAAVTNQIQMVGVNKKNQQKMIRDILPRQEQLKRKRDALRTNLEKLQLADEPELINNESLEDELKVLKQKMQERTSTIEQVDTKVKSLIDDVALLKDKRKNLLSHIEGLEERIPPLTTEINRLSDEQKEFNVNKNVETRRLQEARRNMDGGKEKLEKIKTGVSKQIELAGGEDKRVQTDKKSKEIEIELQKIDEKLQQLNTSTDINEISKKYKIIMDKYSQAMEFIAEIETNKNKISKLLRERSKHYDNTKKYFAHYLDYNFQEILSYRQYKGGITINFDEKTLDLIVIPQHGSQQVRTITTNLSGGERSFSTVAFLYAMWKVLSCPFYFLDEFDVFMDKLNRTKVVEILIHHARQKPETQFVFLTPQDTSFILEDDVSLHRLEDPERRSINN